MDEKEERDLINGLSKVGQDSFEHSVTNFVSEIGSATVNKLINSGLDSLESIACTAPRIIQKETGLGEKTVDKLIKLSLEKIEAGFKSAEDVWETRKQAHMITTGSQDLDELIGGGIEPGCIVEFFGEFRTGKTQIAHQLCVNVQLPIEQGGLNGNALYIDSENTFRPKRIIQMSEYLNLDYRQVLKNITYGKALNSHHQMKLVKDAANHIREKNIKLIIVDSLIGHFRSEYIGKDSIIARQQMLNMHIHDLLRLTDIHQELAVVITNQVQAKINVFYGDPIQPTGGNIVAHGSTIRVYLRKGKGEQRIAKLVDAPHLPEADCIFIIADDGILDVN